MNHRSLSRIGFFAAVLVLLNSCTQPPKTETVTISNTSPRRDLAGRILDAHDGCLQFFNGRFYLYGSAFGTNHDYMAFNCPFVVYSSPDLKSWTFEGKLIPSPPNGVYYRPYVVYNARTRKYVLWYNWYPALWKGQDGVAVSDKPTGPFTIVNPKAHLAGSDPGDGSLFVDDDGTGYYIYTDIAQGYAVRVEQLTPDFLDSRGKTSNVMATGNESPVLFRRNNIYYALCGPLCASCAKGSEVQVFTSLSPLGPFSTRLSENINRRSLDTNSPSSSGVTNAFAGKAPAKAGQKGWFSFGSESTVPIIHAQQTWIAKIPAGDNSAYIWMGDCWQSSPDGLIAHDYQFWSPLEFAPDGQILPLKNLNEWRITWTFNN